MAVLATSSLPKELNLRTVNLLQSAGVVAKFELSQLSDNLSVVLDNPDSSTSLDPKGPLLVVKESESNASLYDPTELICHTNELVRKGIFRHLKLQNEKATLELSNRTVSLISKSSSAIESTDRSEWQPAAIQLHDSIKSDFLYLVSAFKQAMLLRNPELCTELIERILNPTLEIVDSVTPALTVPTEQMGAIKDAGDEQVGQSSGLHEYMDYYLETYGFIPLFGKCSAAGWIDRWRRRFSGMANKEIWESIWEWNEKNNSVLKDYHACQIFLCTPGLIEQGSVNLLWNCLERVLLGDDSGRDSSAFDSWRLRVKLSRHYCKHLETLLPGQNGEAMACFAWWMAEKVCALFNNSRQTISEFLESIDSRIEVAEYTWFMGRSRIEPSALRYYTIFLDSIWNRSIALDVVRLVSAKGMAYVPEHFRERAVGSLMSLAVEGVAQGCERDLEIYPFAQDMPSAVIEWHDMETQENVKMLLNETIRRVESQSNIDFFVQQLKHPQDLDATDQLFLAIYMRQLAYSDNAPTEEIWQILNDDDLRYGLFSTFEEAALDTLLQAFLELQLLEGDKWVNSLPHILAISTKDLLDDEDRSSVLALFTIFCSINVDAVGAIQRMLVEIDDQRTSSFILRWKDIFDSVKPYSPQWIRARHRVISLLLRHN